MADVAVYLKRVLERTKYKREYFVEKNIPTEPSNVLAVPFYGDLPSTVILSSYILRSYKELNRDKYLIVCSWPGFRGMFPYADEFWSLSDESVTKSLATGANSFYNESSLVTDLSHGLLECVNILTHRDIQKWYDSGFTDQYWQTFKQLQRYFPEIPSETRIAENFLKQLDRKPGRKVLIYPATKMRSWQQGKAVYLPISKDFWSVLLEVLLENGFSPVVWQNWFTYDMSRDFVDRCIYLVPRDVVDVFAAMRHIGLVLDVHTGISRMASVARCPFLAVDERLRYVGENDYIIDDLTCESLPRQYVFSFSTMLMAGGRREWEASLLQTTVARLKTFDLDRSDWGSTHESYEPASYDKVRRRKAQRMGLHFIRSAKAK